MNAFQPLHATPDVLRPLGLIQPAERRFEAACAMRTGQGIGKPHLDLLADDADGLLGVESTCTEYLAPKAATFSPTYARRIVDTRAKAPCVAEMRRLADAPGHDGHLDAAQLIKHAFGLAHCFSDRRTVLASIFREPANAAGFELFARHRAELREFADRIASGSPTFTAMSHQELWAAWEQPASPDWLCRHAAALRARYDVPI